MFEIANSLTWFFVNKGEYLYSPFRLNEEKERVTIDPADFYKIFYGKRCSVDDPEAIRAHLMKCLPAQVTPGKTKKKNKAKKASTSSPAALVVQSSDEEGDDDETDTIPTAVAIPFVA